MRKATDGRGRVLAHDSDADQAQTRGTWHGRGPPTQQSQTLLPPSYMPS